MSPPHVATGAQRFMTKLTKHQAGLATTSGHIRYRDLDLSHPSEEELTRYRRERIGFIFQFYNLIP